MFLEVLAEARGRFNLTVHAYCLMTNHYYLLLETPDGNLSKGMRQLNGLYTQRFDTKHRRVGHVFQGRYKAIVVQKETYLLEVARYIVLNPVRARMVCGARDWPWSRYWASAGLAECSAWLETNRILSSFSTRRAAAVEGSRAFVVEGKNQLAVWEQLKHPVCLGTNAFVPKMMVKLSERADLSEVPLGQRRTEAKLLKHDAARVASRDARDRIDA